MRLQPSSGRLVLIGAVALALAGCGGLKNVPTVTLSDGATPTASATVDTSLLSIDPASVMPTFISEFNQVEELAKSWKPDAQFYGLTASWPTTLAQARGKRVYIFGSPSNPTVWWTVALNEQTNERIRSIIPKEDYLGTDLVPVAQQFWKLNALEALQIAEKAGGTTFRQNNPGAEVTSTLAHRGPKGWLWWVVTYRADNNRELLVRIHPSSGEIYTEDGEPMNTATPTPSATSSPQP